MRSRPRVDREDQDKGCPHHPSSVFLQGPVGSLSPFEPSPLTKPQSRRTFVKQCREDIQTAGVRKPRTPGKPKVDDSARAAPKAKESQPQEQPGQPQSLEPQDDAQPKYKKWGPGFTNEIIKMMYVSGETAEPSAETTGMVEEIVRQQVIEMVKSSQLPISIPLSWKSPG